VNVIVGNVDTQPEPARVDDEKVTCFFLFADRKAKCIHPEAPRSIKIESCYRYEGVTLEHRELPP